MLVRTKYGIGESISNDRGKTWSALIPSSIQNPVSRFFIRRLSSGNLLLVKNGPISERIGRSHLTAYLSKDDGYTWLGGLLLDERISAAYPDGQQISDGTIYISSDHSRIVAREILFAKFTEDDVITGDIASATVSLRNVISKHSDIENYKKVFIHEATVKFISQQKDNEIRYTIDGTEPDHNPLLYTQPFKVNKTTKFEIKEFTPDGAIRSTYEAYYIKQKPISPTSEIINISGLNFDYFEFSEPIDLLVDLQKYKPTKNGETDRFIYPHEVGKLPEYFGLNFSGYIKIPAEAVYSFSVVSNDGALLFIDDKLVVDNDGKHGTSEKEGEIALQKGFHKIELSYFQAGGGKDLKVFWQGTGFEKQEIPASVLFHENLIIGNFK
jgi:PA14 domain/BNR repeat-like domain/Fn3 associated